MLFIKHSKKLFYSLRDVRHPNAVLREIAGTSLTNSCLVYESNVDQVKRSNSLDSSEALLREQAEKN